MISESWYNTTFNSAEYPPVLLKPLFERCKIKHPDKDYLSEGLVVLRAAVMTPYITAARSLVDQDYCGQFMQELAVAGEEGFRVLTRKSRAK
jgi:hypothetical protein